MKLIPKVRSTIQNKKLAITKRCFDLSEIIFKFQKKQTKYTYLSTNWGVKISNDKYPNTSAKM